MLRRVCDTEPVGPEGKAGQPSHAGAKETRTPARKTRSVPSEHSDVNQGVALDNDEIGVGTGGYPALRLPSPTALAAMVVAARRACRVSFRSVRPVPAAHRARRRAAYPATRPRRSRGPSWRRPDIRPWLARMAARRWAMAGGGAGPAGILPAVTLTTTPLAAIRSSRAGSASTPPAVKNVTCSRVSKPASTASATAWAPWACAAAAGPRGGLHRPRSEGRPGRTGTRAAGCRA